VFWLPQEDTSVVVLTTAPPELVIATEQRRFDLLDFAAPDGTESVLRCDLGDGHYLQLERHGANADGTPFVAAVPLGLEGFDRLEAVHRLLSALHGRVVPPDTRLTSQQRARLRRMLQAFDGLRDGATQQEIAQVVFDTGRLNRDEWQMSSTRHAVMSLLRDARTLIEGGYRKLLRHRRRS